MPANLVLERLDFRKKIKFSLLLNVNLLYLFKCKKFFLALAYFCSKVIILIFLLVKFIAASF